MKKIDFKGVAMRVAGVAVGVVAGAQADANLAKIEALADGKKRCMILIAAGTLAPMFLPLPKNNELIQNALDGVLARGVELAMREYLPADQVDKLLPAVAGIGNYEQFLGNPYLGENLYLGEELQDVEMVQDPETGAFYEMKNGELVPANVSMNGTYEDNLI
jgi:hypothetical protein